jgi:hypothetical protein
MAETSCTPFHPRLSALLDGALSSADQAEVEAHLETCGDCSVRLAELAVASQALRSHFEAEASSVDWAAFTAKVMAKVEPAPVSLRERIQQWMDALLPQRGWGLVAAGALGMAVVMGAGYLGLGGGQGAGRKEGPGYGADKMAVKQVQTDPTLVPVVMESEQGSIIWLVDHPQSEPQPQKDAEKTDGGSPKAADVGEEGDL